MEAEISEHDSEFDTAMAEYFRNWRQQYPVESRRLKIASASFIFIVNYRKYIVDYKNFYKTDIACRERLIYYYFDKYYSHDPDYEIMKPLYTEKCHEEIIKLVNSFP